MFQGEHDSCLQFVDSSKVPTPASRYGCYYSIYHPKSYHSGSITPLSYQSHPFEMLHVENLREKLHRLSHDKGSLYSFILYDVSFASKHEIFVF